MKTRICNKTEKDTKKLKKIGNNNHALSELYSLLIGLTIAIFAQPTFPVLVSFSNFGFGNYPLVLGSVYVGIQFTSSTDISARGRQTIIVFL